VCGRYSFVVKTKRRNVVNERANARAVRYSEAMCGRLARERDIVFERFGVEELRETRARVDLRRYTDRYNIAPTQGDIIIADRDGARRLVESRWGLIPSWAKDRRIGSRTFNARAETLTERAAFRSLLSARRCIIVASGFYEWRTVPGQKQKQPLYIRRRDGAPLALAGLWTVWHDPERDEPVVSHTIITCAANGFMAPVHARMPVVLDDAGVDVWLDPSVRDPALLLPLLVPCPDDVLSARPVAPLVNRPDNDGPELIAPLRG
jgi:putative SOS response-associated peptidase YedK